MKFKKRKIKYAAIFFICWFAFLVFLIDGVLKFQTLVDYFGSYALVEMAWRWRCCYWLSFLR